MNKISVFLENWGTQLHSTFIEQERYKWLIEGLSKLQTVNRIILPQAVKNILPAIGNEFIALLKETSVAGYVAVKDLTRAGNLIRNNTFDAFNPLIAVAIVYLVLVIIITAVLGKFERRLSGSDRGKKPKKKL